MDNCSNHDNDGASVDADTGGLIPIARPVGAVPMARVIARNTLGPSIDDPMRLNWVPSMTCVINLLIAIAGFFVLQFAAAAIAMPELLTAPESVDETNIDMSIMAPVGIGMLLLIVIMLRLENIPLPSIGMTVRSFGVEALIGIPTAAVGYGVFLLFTVTAYFVAPDAYKSIEGNTDNIAAMMPESGLLGLFGIMVCVAVYEEVFFRGLILTHLRRITRSWIVAVLAGSVLFAAGHTTQAAVVAVPLFGLGVVLSWVTIWRRSLTAAMVGHFLFNYGQIVVLTLLPDNPLSDKMKDAVVALVRIGWCC